MNLAWLASKGLALFEANTLTVRRCRGSRTCPGQAMVLAEISYTIVRLLQEFRGLESRDDRPWVEDLKLTMANYNGVRIGLTPA